MIFNGVVAESITLCLASIPVLYKLYLSSSNTSLPLGLAACIGISAALSVFELVSPPREQQRVAAISPRESTALASSVTAECQEPSVVESSETPPPFSHSAIGEEYQLEDEAGVPTAATTTSTAVIRRRRNGPDQTPPGTRFRTAIAFGRDRDMHQDHCFEDYHSAVPTPIGEARTKATATAKTSKNGPIVSGFRGKGNGYLHAHVLEELALPFRTETTKTVAGATRSRPITSPCITRITNRRCREGCDDPNVAEVVEQETMGIAGNIVPPARFEAVAGFVKRLGFGVLGGIARLIRYADAKVRTGVARDGHTVAAGESRPGGRSSANGGVGVREESKLPFLGVDEVHRDRSAPSARLDLQALDPVHKLPHSSRDAEVVLDEGKSRVAAGVGGVAAIDVGLASTAKASGNVVKLNGNSTVANDITSNRIMRIGGKRELVASKRSLQPSALDGLAVGVATVPMVLSSTLLLLCQLKSADSVEESGGGVSAEQTVGERDGSDWVEYLGNILEGSLMCAAWEVMSALQGVFGGRRRRRRSIVWGVVLNSLFRVAVLVAGCVHYCRRPLLPLCCLVIFDITRRALASGDGDVMRRLSLRSGEAAILAHALALWAVDACLYTLQELWLSDPSAWDWLFPYAPYRTSSTVVIQTGIIGTLVTGLAMAGARQLMASAWASDSRGHSVSYAVLAGGTAAWLLSWTAPLLGTNPVTWAVLYALGVPPERAKAVVLGKAQEAEKLWSFAAEWPDWAKSAVSRYGQAWSASAATLETCTGVVVRGGVDQNRPLLVAWWLVALAVVVPLTPWVSRRLSLSKTTSRKIFHALATAMFVPAIYLELNFLSLALGTALGILLALEFLRCAGCTHVARALDGYYGGFLDARDGGRVVVTHLFLLLGCAVPVWLSGLLGESASVLPYTGVVVLGIGDAMGAVVGSSVGRLHWPGSRRTLEGSVAVLLSSLITLVSISLFMVDEASSMDGYGLARAVTSLAWPVTVASLMEAFTTQVDNLVLPCVLFSCLALRDV